MMDPDKISAGNWRPCTSALSVTVDSCDAKSYAQLPGKAGYMKSCASALLLTHLLIRCCG